MRRLYLLIFLLLVGGWSARAQNIQVTGNITASSSDCSTAGSCVSLNLPVNAGVVAFSVAGTFSGTLQFEEWTGVTNAPYVSVSCFPPSSTSSVTSTTSTGTWSCVVTAMKTFRIRASAFASGTAQVGIALANNPSASLSGSSGSGGGGGGGGSGTVSGQAAGVIPLGTSATVIGNQSHLDDGVTTAGVVTSTEPIAVITGTGNAGGYIAGQGISNGNPTAHAVTIQAPVSVPSSYDFTVPGTPGTAGGSLLTDGTGITSWGPPIIPNGANFVFDGDSRTAGAGSTASCGASPCTIGTTGYAAITTGTATSGSTALTIASGTGTANGQGVFGIGIAAGTTVSSGGGTTSIVLSQATISALSTTAVRFGNMDYPSQAMRLFPFSGQGTGYNLGVSGQSCGQISARYATDAHTLSPAVTSKPGYFFLNCGTNAETPATPTATGTSTQLTIVVSSVTGIELGDAVTGTGIGASAKVANTWNGTTTVPVTVANSGTVSGTITFTPSATSIAQAIAYVWSLAKADGYTIIGTTNPMHVAQSSTRNLNDLYNDAIRGYQSAYNGFDRLMDVQALLPDTYDPNYFASDATHFLNQGYQVWAQAAASAVSLPGGFNMMSLRRFANLGSGSGNERYNDTCANLAGNTNITCAGYGSMTAATGASFITVYGDNDLNGCTSCQSIAVQGHGIGNNIISGGSDVFLNGDSTGDVSFSEAIGTGASVSGNDAIALGRSSSAIANSIGIGSGVANAAGAVVIDPTFGAATNAKANTMQYQGANFVDAAGYLYGTNKQYVTTDFTDSTSTTLTAITGLSWTLPTSRAAVFSFHCGLLFDQATAAVSDSFGVGVTGTAPTNLSASGTVFTAAGVETTGTLVGLASTTPTAVVTFTPSAITTVWKAELDGTIEQPSNATPGVFNIYVSTTTGGDNIIVKRGSYCSLF